VTLVVGVGVGVGVDVAEYEGVVGGNSTIM